MTAAPATTEARNLDAVRPAGPLPYLLLPYLALVLVHVVSGLEMRQPIVLADELGYLGNARYLAGAADLPDMRGSQFYHFGYSLFLLPAFWLFSEPTSIYRAAVVINSLLVSALFFPLSFILRSFAGVSATAARWIAFACCLYPSLLLYSNLAWSENAFTPLYAVVVALFGRVLASGSARGLLPFGLLAGLLYTVHPRALPVLAAILVYLLLLAILRVVPVGRLALGAVAMAAVVVATRVVNTHLRELAWAGGGEVSATRLAARLVPGADFWALIERALGQLLYLALASHGLFVLGLMAMLWLIVRGVRSGSLRRALAEPRSGVPLFILATAGGIFAAACTLKLYSLHGPRAVRGADFIHGRYNEALAVFAIAFALAELWQRGVGTRRLAGRVAVAAALILGLAAVVMAEVDDALDRQTAGRARARAREVVLPSDVDAIAVPGVYPFVGLVGGLKLYPISLLAIASLLLIAVTMRLSRRGGIALLVLLFCSFAYYNHRYYVQRRVAIAEPRLSVATELRRLGPFATVSYDSAIREPGFVPGLQYLLQESAFEPFDGAAGEAPGSEAVLATIDWPQADSLGARLVISSGRGGAFFLLPGAAQSRLAPPSYVGLTLGAEPRPELREIGFYRAESFDGRPGRWTNGAASLTVPLDPLRPPRYLVFQTLAPGRERTRFQVVANGVELWNRNIPSRAFARKLDLQGVPLGDRVRIDLNSRTFSPAKLDAASGDRRELGVVILGLRLQGRQRPRPTR